LDRPIDFSSRATATRRRFIGGGADFAGLISD
jgi:hypothetical protein